MERSRFNIDVDPIEKTQKYKEAMKHIEPILDEEFKEGRGLGMCHAYWNRKKQLL
ncbi:MAG: hypothetical protein J1E35_05125 [Lachnospiraceae bacterium]|nr:hypothetical protein [Lachnospiraceae bacterium]